jgi:TonB-linked SusC/RagA family outer membrane protein
MKRYPLSWLRGGAGTLLLLAGLTTQAAAQQPQTVLAGRVTLEGSGVPIGDARVIVVGTNLVVATNAEGRYTIRGVPTGAVEVRVNRVGYVEQKKPVTIQAGQTATLDFALRQTVVQLQEIVTTATGQQRAAETGVTIASVPNVTVAVNEGRATSVSDLLAAKVPGASVLLGSMTGTAGTIRLRGLNSMSLSNAPIWIVDGVRFNAGSVGVSTGGQSTTLLNSLNPEEVENIEVVKGPAAATLYGTNAANGVIVVTTKKGAAGNARWNWYTEQGIVTDEGAYPDSYMMWGHTAAAPATQRRCQLVEVAANSCIVDSVTTFNPIEVAELTPLKTGYRNQYGLQVSGGTAQLRYFVSGEVERETGPIEMPDVDQERFRAAGTPIRDEWMNPEQLGRIALRANLNSAVNDKFDLSVTSMYVRTNQRLTQTDNNTFSIFYQTMMNPGFRGAGPGRNPRDALGRELNGNNNFTMGDIFQRYVAEDIHRVLGSVNGNWRPLSWLTADGTVGIDLADRRDFTLCRFNECPPSGQTRLGTVSSAHNNNRNLSARFVTTGQWQLNSAIGLTTTLGADYTNVGADGSSSSGSRLPPGAQTVGSAAITSGGATLPTATKTLGYVLQQRVAINDRLFIAAAARSDKNSAFGVDYKNAIYPSMDVSWVASEESFFPQIPALGYLRLRAAYGAAGQQPGSTSALDTYSAPTVNIDGVDTPGLRASQLGNSELKPETSTEFETGFDARLLQDRISFDVTYYRKKTKDALLDQPIAPSSGASDLSILRNIGSVKNTGWETSVNAQLLDRPAFGWNVTFAAARNENEILSLGIDPVTGLPDGVNGTGTTRDSVGLPVSGRFNRKFTYQDTNGDGYITADEVQVDEEFSYVGPSQPINTMSLTNSFDLFNRKLRLYAMLDSKTGHVFENTNARFLCTNNAASSDRSNPDASLKDQARCVAALRASPTTTNGYLEKGDFIRLREVSATFNLPQRWSQVVRAGDISLSVAGRNLALWSDYSGVDPEANYSTGDVQANIASSSPRRYYTLRLNLSY